MPTGQGTENLLSALAGLAGGYMEGRKREDAYANQQKQAWGQVAQDVLKSNPKATPKDVEGAGKAHGLNPKYNVFSQGANAPSATPAGGTPATQPQAAGNPAMVSARPAGPLGYIEGRLGINNAKPAQPAQGGNSPFEALRQMAVSEQEVANRPKPPTDQELWLRNHLTPDEQAKTDQAKQNHTDAVTLNNAKLANTVSHGNNAEVVSLRKMSADALLHNQPDSARYYDALADQKELETVSAAAPGEAAGGASTPPQKTFIQKPKYTETPKDKLTEAQTHRMNQNIAFHDKLDPETVKNLKIKSQAITANEKNQAAKVVQGWQRLALDKQRVEQGGQKVALAAKNTNIRLEEFAYKQAHDGLVLGQNVQKNDKDLYYKIAHGMVAANAMKSDKDGNIIKVNGQPAHVMEPAQRTAILGANAAYWDALSPGAKVDDLIRNAKGTALEGKILAKRQQGFSDAIILGASSVQDAIKKMRQKRQY
jgi:hypothetical protein